MDEQQQPPENQPGSINTGQGDTSQGYPQQPTTDEQKKASNRKKWLWGCGGCLGVVLLIAIIMGVVGVGCWNKFQEGSTAASAAIFGKHPPQGYVIVGAQLPPETGVNNLLLLVNQNNRQQMVFAFDSKLSPAQAELLRAGETSEEELKKLLAGALSGAPGGGNSVEVDKLRIDHVTNYALPSGVSVPMIDAKIEDDGTYMPSTIALLPHPKNRLVGLAGLDVVTKTTQADADFTSNYQTLQALVQSIITESDLDDSTVK